MSDETLASQPENFFALPPVAADEKAEAYWMGTLPSCPFYNVSAGGISFERYTDPPTGSDPDSLQTQRAWSKGDVKYLTQSQVEAVRRNVKDKVVRFVGNRGQGFIFSLGSPQFSREAHDQPLAMFIYMVPMNEAAAAMRNTPKGGYPKSMYEMAGGQAQPVVPERSKKPVADIAPEIEDLDKPAALQHVPPQLKGGKR